MNIRYYLSIFPTEALIASNLEPAQFGAYMATGAKNGSYERIVFIEIEGGQGDYFDWKAAEERCHPHEDGRPKNSVWLSVYRVLEHVPLTALKDLYMTTLDGRTLCLAKGKFVEDTHGEYYVYNELCPINPLVVSKLNPLEFSQYMTDTHNKVAVPKVAFADLKTINLDEPTKTGNIGRTYDRNLEHFKNCVRQVLSLPDKLNKNVERSHVEDFSYSIVNRGIYLGDGKNLVMYPMLDMADLRKNHYDWARSALIF
ncbi:MAG: hypothetical protein GW949_10710 [Spirochaetales bacterium]|nr:hypothetical protein [Spirochaetales bacterium]